MLDDYKQLCKKAADVVPDWETMTKNELCRAFVSHKGDEISQNAYFSAILYKYWNLIGKYYYMSSNCASPEECYSWLVDSVACCVNMASWEDPKSSIYGDPNGPDKVINRCMKCARLTYYQFINRKKRRDDFGSLSIDELKELYGTDVSDEIHDHGQDVDVSSIVIKQYVIDMFERKDYFVAFLIDCIISSSVFDIAHNKDKNTITTELNIRKLCSEIRKLDYSYLQVFSENYDLPLDEVIKAHAYIKGVQQSSLKKKVLQSLDTLKHSEFIKTLRGNRHVD